VHSCSWSVTQHEITSTLTLCSVSGLADLWAGPSAPHSTLGIMLRSVEASSEAPGAIRTGSLSGRLSTTGTRLLDGVKGLPTAAADARQVFQAATLRCGQDQSASANQTPQGPHLLSKDSQGSHGGSVSTSGASDWCHHWLRPSVALGAPSTSQEEGLLLLCAPTPSVDRRVTVATMEDEYAVGKALSGASPQLLASRLCPPQHRSMLGAPRDRVQECSVAQPEEDLDAAPWNCVVERIMIVH
ncbi:Hypothetical protein DHA2_152867, partial [Giardia duodenalis]